MALGHSTQLAGAAHPHLGGHNYRVGARLVWICLLFLGCAVVLVGRLFIFQVRDTTHYQQLADDERRAEIPIVARRGSLLDTSGNPLAESVEYDSVYAVGSLVGDPDKTAAVLAPILGMQPSEIRARLDPNNQQLVVLKSQLPSAESAQIANLDLPGVRLDKEPIRQYPEGSLAAQILGFVGHDFKGLAGLELSYDSELAGTPGVIDTEKDTDGKEITLGRRLLTPPVQGSDVVLTIDRYVQRTAEQLLAQGIADTKAKSGLIMVMDPHTGDVVAAATNPTYNLTADDVYDPSKSSLYKTSVVTDQYEPGSTMKTITAGAAIDAGLITPDTTYNDTGVAVIDGLQIHNWNNAGNGVITMTQMLIYSSNVAAQWVGGQLGPDRFYNYVNRFGFGQPTGIRLPGEVGGTVRTNSDPGWSRVDLATNAFGQGIAVTPLQILRAVAAYGNDGLMMQPRIVSEIRGPTGAQELPPQPAGQVVTPSTAHTVLTMMTADGAQDAYRPYRVPGYPLAVKSGTADTSTSNGYDLNHTIASVVAFLPATNPRYVVLIRLDSPPALFGGTTVIPILQQLSERIFDYYRISPTDPGSASAPAP